MPPHFDLIAIGGGSGGIAVAQRAARYGARCALITDGELGGTCVHRGCVPKKILWHAADLASALHEAPDYGFDRVAIGFDWDHLRRSRDTYLERLAHLYRDRLTGAGVELIGGRATFCGPRTLAANGIRYTADHIVIATGGRPLVPDVPGAELGMTSDGLFELKRRPQRIAIVGAGYVAVEFGSILRHLGSEVTVLMRGERLISGFDRMLGEVLMKEMGDAGVRFVEGTYVEAVDKEPAGTLVLTTGEGERLGGFDVLLWAVGRCGNIHGLSPESAGVDIDENRGCIPTDAFQNTSATGVYAIGDVTGQAALTPLAIAAGRRLADRLFGGLPDSRVDYGTVPTVVFSHPPVATVGLSEDDARDRYGDAVRVYRSTYTPLYHAMTARKVRAAVKLITLGEEERVIGCHVVGPGTEEILQGFAIAIRMGATKRDFDETVAIHPSGAEELLNMR